MTTLTNLPLYLNCFHFGKKEANTVTYKIVTTQNQQYPFQLFKWIAKESKSWQNLSIHVSVLDVLRVLLKELLSEDLSDEVYHGQATVNPAAILEKINCGERLISIYGSTDNGTFRKEFDILFENLVQKTSTFKENG